MIQKMQDAIASTMVNYDKLPQSKAATTADMESAGQEVQQASSSASAADSSSSATAAEAGASNKVQQTDEEKKKGNAEEITKEDASNITKALNELMDKMNCDLEFKYYDKLDQLTVKMVDKKTKETIKEFPPEEIIKAMIKTKDWIGTFLDKLA